MSITKADTGRTFRVEEFMALPLDPGQRYELVRGIIKEMSHPGREHGLVSARLTKALNSFLLTQDIGEVLPPTGYKLIIPGVEKDSVRSPDLSFLVKEKLAGPPGAVTDIPDLAVEVHSPNDEPGELGGKLADYQAAGWDLVWVVYPPNSSPQYKAATVDVYRLKQSLEPVLRLRAQEELDGSDVLPGFKLPVSALFS